MTGTITRGLQIAGAALRLGFDVLRLRRRAPEQLPSAAQITAASEGLFVHEDWHNFGADYDRTLQAWRGNIEGAWPRLSARYDERFRRMWRYYLHASMAAFRSRNAQLWQLVLSRDGVPGGYVAPR